MRHFFIGFLSRAFFICSSARSVVGAFVFALLTSTTAIATILERFDLDDLAARSDVVIVGTVVSERVSEDAQGIFTVTTVRVDTALRGLERSGTEPRGTGPHIEVTRRGGEMNGVATDVVGDASLPVGARMLLFTHAAKDGHRFISGMVQGAFFDDDDGHFSQAHTVALLSRKGVVENGPHQFRVTLDDVKAALSRSKNVRGPR